MVKSHKGSDVSVASSTAQDSGTSYTASGPAPDLTNEQQSADTPLLDLASDEERSALEVAGVAPGAGRAKKNRAGSVAYSEVPDEVEQWIKSLVYTRVKLLKGSWSQLDFDEQVSLLKYIDAKERFAKETGMKKPAYHVSVKGAVKLDMADEDVAKLEAQAQKNWQDVQSQDASTEADGVIAVAEKTREVPVSQIVQQEQEEAKVFDGGSTFPSDRWQAEDMNQTDFNDMLEEAAAEIARLRGQYGPELGLDVFIESGESQVPSKAFPVPGQLAAKRAETAEAQARAYLSAAGVDLTNVVFKSSGVVGPTPWQPAKGDTASMDKFTQEQFLRASVGMNGKPAPVVEYGEPENEASVVEMNTYDIHHGKPSKDRGGNKNNHGGQTGRPKKMKKEKWSRRCKTKGKKGLGKGF